MACQRNCCKLAIISSSPKVAFVFAHDSAGGRQKARIALETNVFIESSRKFDESFPLFWSTVGFPRDLFATGNNDNVRIGELSALIGDRIARFRTRVTFGKRSRFTLRWSRRLSIPRSRARRRSDRIKGAGNKAPHPTHATP